MKNLLYTLLGYKKYIITEDEYGLLYEDGNFVKFLTADQYYFSGSAKTEVKRFLLMDDPLPKALAVSIRKNHPKQFEDFILPVDARSDEIKIIRLDGKIKHVIKEKEELFLVQHAGTWDMESFDITDGLIVPKAIAKELMLTYPSALKTLDVSPYTKAVLSINAKFVGIFEAGRHLFWRTSDEISTVHVDMRQNAYDVTGQEILTKDKASIRVNISAEYKITDLYKALFDVTDFKEALHRALQFAFRKALGEKTLDETLTNKALVDTEVLNKVQSDMAAIGLDVRDISLKDIILPGELRDIYNNVIQAQKEAEANVIRRREETAATRSLLNTTKVMQEHPLMFRLKELEVLENISKNVNELKIYSGTEGLLTNMTRINDSE